MIRYIYYGVFIFCFSMCLSCQFDYSIAPTRSNHPSIKSKSILKGSRGGINELKLVINPLLYQTSIGDSIDRYLSKSYAVLPQIETNFRYVPIAYPDLENHFSASRNAIIFCQLDQKDKHTEAIKKTFGAERLKQMLWDRGMFFLHQTNYWANPQQLYFILAKNEKQLKRAIPLYMPRILNQIDKKDLDIAKEKAYTKGSINVQNQCMSIQMPRDYKLAKKEGAFSWWRKDNETTVYNIFIDCVSTRDSPTLNQIIEKRNQWGMDYVQSNVKGAYMQTSEILGFEKKEIRIQGCNTLVVYGLWEMNTDAKGGPFVHYCIEDKKAHQLIFIEGFIYAPGQKKRILLKQIEAIIQTVRVKEN